LRGRLIAEAISISDREIATPKSVGSQ